MTRATTNAAAESNPLVRGASGMRIGSLFSGIGGLELGLEWAGLGPVIWQVEQDEFCRAVLAKHWPEAERFDDVCTVGKATLAPVDLICGGFPCQDISRAGKGEGLAGERSGLWFEYARIVGELGPRFVVVENVTTLLNNGMGDVLGSLAALGYHCWWDCIPAAAVGAPHLRDRVFVVAYAGRLGRELRGGVDDLAAKSSKEGPARPAVGHGGDDVPGLQARLREFQRWATDNGTLRESPAWETEPAVGRVADGVSGRMDRLSALGNAVVPQCAEVVGRLIQELAR